MLNEQKYEFDKCVKFDTNFVFVYFDQLCILTVQQNYFQIYIYKIIGYFNKIVLFI